MPKTQPLEDDLAVLAMKVACLKCEGIQQREIATLLGIKSQAAVSRLLKVAREEGWIIERPNLPDGRTAADLGIGAIDAGDLNKLEKGLNKLAVNSDGRRLSQVHVLHSGDKNEERLKRFAASAAQRVISLLERFAGSAAQRSTSPPELPICGVSWGRTVSHVVAAVVKCHPEADSRHRSIGFIPVAGEKWTRTQQEGISPSVAAKQLAHSFCHPAELKKEPPLSLQGIPVRIPKELHSHTAVIQRFLNACDAYNSIFTDPKKIARIEALITGIGDTDSENAHGDPAFQETVRLEDINPDKLTELAIGNLAGVWFPRRKETAKKIREINSRWLGIAEEHIVSCAKQPELDETRPGVMVFAAGPDKAEIILKAMGKVNQLFIDQTLAEALLKKLEP